MNKPSGKRSSRRSDRATSPSTDRWLLAIDLVVCSMLVAAQAAAAWWFGGVTLTGQFVLGSVIVLALLLAWIRGSFGKSQGVRLPWISLALLAALLWGGLQTLPLGEGIVRAVGPEQYRLRQAMTGTATNTQSETPESGSTLSLHPHATRMDWSLLALSVAVFVAASVTFHRSLSTVVTLLLAATNGLAIAFFGLVQQMNWEGQIYWHFTSPSRSSFGSFVNPNNAGGYLNLCLAAAIGLALYVFAEKKGKLYVDLTRTYQSSLFRVAHRLRWELAHLTARKLFALAFAGFIAAGVFCTLSRGAILALAFAAVLTALTSILARRSFKGLIVAIALIMGGIGIANWVGMSSDIGSELASISDELDGESVRFSLWSSLKPAADDYWLTGSGLGTFRHMYRSYADFADTRWFYHAENQYIEAFLDAGLPGLLLMLVAIGGVAYAALLLIRRGTSRRHWSLGLATIFALSSQVFQAGFDFGLYLPANAWLLAIFSGACCGEAMMLHKRRRKSKRRTPRRFAWLSTPIWFAIFVFACLATIFLYRGARLESAMKRGPQSLDGSDLDANEVRQAIVGLAPWCQRTGSAEGWNRLADLSIAEFRLRRLEEISPTYGPLNAEQKSDLWLLTSPIEIHRQAYIVYRSQGDSGVTQWLGSSAATEALAAAFGQLLQSRASCPILADTHLRLAQTSLVAGSITADRIHLDRATTLAPNRPSVMYTAGLLDLQADRLQECGQRWQVALRLAADKYRQRAIQVAMEQLPVDVVVLQIVPQNPAVMLEIAGELAGDPARVAALREGLWQRAEELLTAHSRIPEEAHTLGVLYKTRGDWTMALDAYNEAIVGRNRYRKEWLLERAEVCIELNDFVQAQTDVVLVLSLDNDWPAAKRLGNKINRIMQSTKPPD